MKLQTLTAATLTLGLTLPAHAMDYSIEQSTDKYLVVTADGHIEQNEIQRFRDFNQDHNIDLDKDRRGKILLLASQGGNALGAKQLADYIQAHNLGTSVLSNECASACVIIWAAGESRYATPGSLGVHQPINLIDPTHDNTGATKVFTQWLADRGAPESVIRATETTPPADIYWLSCAEIQEWGATIPDKTLCENNKEFLSQSSATWKDTPLPQPKPTSGETLKGHQLVFDFLAYCKKWPNDCRWDSKHKFSHLHGADID
jgi:hypothetical protein